MMDYVYALRDYLIGRGFDSFVMCHPIDRDIKCVVVTAKPVSLGDPVIVLKNTDGDEHIFIGVNGHLVEIDIDYKGDTNSPTDTMHFDLTEPDSLERIADAIQCCSK